jgi:regulator of sirC expression with transglutaminase-like and TPR domain
MPLGTAIRVQLARALAETNKTDKAIETLEYVVEIDPGNGEAAVPLASIYQQMDRTQEALALLKGVAAHTPGQKDVEDYMQELESASSAG